MNSYQSGYAEINGAKIFYEMKGNGHPLLMIHGYPLDSRMWDTQFDELAKHFLAIRFDTPGNGKSSAHDNDFDLVEDMKDLLLFWEIEKVHLLGLSVGGNLSMDFTLAYPEMVGKLVLASTGLLGWSEFSEQRQKYNESLKECYQNGDLEKVIELMCKAWVAGPYRSLDEISSELIANYSKMLRNSFSKEQGQGKMKLPEMKTIDLVEKIDVPTLLITPDVDFLEFSKIADFLHEKIKESKKIVLTGTAHMINMEKPTEFNKIVLDYLENNE